MTKPKIHEKDYHKVSVRPQNWRNKDKDKGETGPRLKRRGGRGKQQLTPMKNRPGISDRIGVSGRKDAQGRPILTKDAGTIDAQGNFQQDADGRDLNMNIDVKEPGRHGERELDMTDEGVYKRVVRTQQLDPQLPDNFFMD